MKNDLLGILLVTFLLLGACAPQAQPTTAVPVQPTTVEPAAEPSAAPSVQGAVDAALTAGPWYWVSFTSPVEQAQISDPASYVLTFNEDGTLAIKADCNNANAGYTVQDGALTIEVGPMTLAACPPGSRSDEFVKFLGAAARYFFEDKSLLIDLMADGGTLKFSSSSGTATAGNDQLASLGVDISGEPFSGTLFLGGGEERWLDPTLISALGGTSEGPGVNASSLGAGCGFFIPSRPDVTIHWEQQENVETLRFFFLSLGDTGLVLVTPGGDVLCSDDLNPLVLDPYIEVQNPEAGMYTAFLGSYEGAAVYPGFLVVTSQELNPATMDLAQLFPRHVDPQGIPQTLSLEVLEPDSPEAAKPQGGVLSEASLPYETDFTTGGEIGAFNLDQPNPLCTGFISAAPTLSFEWTGNAEPFVMFFESNVDTTLLVRAPDGTFICDDDLAGSENINPSVTLLPERGNYHVWVGSFSPDTKADGKLTITGDSTATPVPLTSSDIQ